MPIDTTPDSTQKPNLPDDTTRQEVDLQLAELDKHIDPLYKNYQTDIKRFEDIQKKTLDKVNNPVVERHLPKKNKQL